MLCHFRIDVEGQEYPTSGYKFDRCVPDALQANIRQAYLAFYEILGQTTGGIFSYKYSLIKM